MGTPPVIEAVKSPIGREGGMEWVDSDGNLWLFGGSGKILCNQGIIIE